MNFRIMKRKTVGVNEWTFHTDEEGFLFEAETREECAQELFDLMNTTPMGELLVVKVLDTKTIIEIEAECPEPQPEPDEPDNSDQPDNPEEPDPDNPDNPDNPEEGGDTPDTPGSSETPPSTDENEPTPPTEGEDNQPTD